MARQKKTSTAVIVKAETRLTGLKSIDAKLDLGGGMTAAAYERQINGMKQKIAAYNTMLAKVDEASNELDELEKKLADMSSRMLASVVGRYGRDSNEYEMAGGVRKSDRKRKKVKPVMEGVMEGAIA